MNTFSGRDIQKILNEIQKRLKNRVNGAVFVDLDADSSLYVRITMFKHRWEYSKFTTFDNIDDIVNDVLNKYRRYVVKLYFRR